MQLLRRFGPDDAYPGKTIQWQGDGWRVEFKGGFFWKLFNDSPDAVLVLETDVGDVPREGMVIRMKVQAEEKDTKTYFCAMFSETSGTENRLLRTDPVKSSGDWVTLETNPAIAGEIRGKNHLLLLVSSSNYGTVFVKDVEIFMP